MKPYPDIDVMVLTYNHEPFIDQCLKGILSQEYGGNVRIVVSDDGSKDATVQKVKVWQAKSPNIILLQAVLNQGPGRNFAKALKECHAELLAFCEGDDFWTDPQKLTMQVKALQAKPEATISYTNFKKVDASGTTVMREVLEPQPEKFILRDLLFTQGPSIHSSLLLRKSLPDQLPEEFFKVSNPDVFVFAMALMQGYGTFTDVVTGAYRLHSGGIWSTLGIAEQKLMRLSTRLVMLRTLRPADWKEYLNEMYAVFSIEMEKAYVTDRSMYTKYSIHLTPFGRKALPLKARLGLR